MTDRARAAPSIAVGFFVVAGLASTANPIHGQVVDSTTIRPTDVVVKIRKDPHSSGT